MKVLRCLEVCVVALAIGRGAGETSKGVKEEQHVREESWTPSGDPDQEAFGQANKVPQTFPRNHSRQTQLEGVHDGPTPRLPTMVASLQDINSLKVLLGKWFGDKLTISSPSDILGVIQVLQNSHGNIHKLVHMVLALNHEDQRRAFFESIRPSVEQVLEEGERQFGRVLIKTAGKATPRWSLTDLLGSEGFEHLEVFYRVNFGGHLESHFGPGHVLSLGSTSTLGVAIKISHPRRLPDARGEEFTVRLSFDEYAGADVQAAHSRFLEEFFQSLGIELIIRRDSGGRYHLPTLLWSSQNRLMTRSLIEPLNTVHGTLLKILARAEHLSSKVPFRRHAVPTRAHLTKITPSRPHAQTKQPQPLSGVRGPADVVWNMASYALFSNLEVGISVMGMIEHQYDCSAILKDRRSRKLLKHIIFGELLVNMVGVVGGFVASPMVAALTRGLGSVTAIQVVQEAGSVLADLLLSGSPRVRRFQHRKTGVALELSIGRLILTRKVGAVGLATFNAEMLIEADIV